MGQFKLNSYDIFSSISHFKITLTAYSSPAHLTSNQTAESDFRRSSNYDRPELWGSNKGDKRSKTIITRLHGRLNLGLEFFLHEGYIKI